MKKKNDDFRLNEKVTPKEAAKEKKASITDQDFQLVDTSEYSHDQKFETKPTTFLKDSIKRFSKNKSSVVATYILGILLLGSVAIPILDTSNVKDPSPYQIYLEPKLFDAGAGFWDGTRNYTDIAYYEDPINPAEFGPDPADFNLSAVSNLKITGQKFVNSYSKFAKGGYVKVGLKGDDINDDCYIENIGFTLDTSVANSVDIVFGEEEIEFTQLAPYRIDFIYDDEFGFEDTIPLIEDYSSDYSPRSFDLTAILTSAFPTKTIYDNAKISIIIDCTDKTADSCVLISSIVFTTDSADANYTAAVTMPNFTDANEMVGRPYKDGNKILKNYWNCNGDKYLYKAVITACSFTYDTYAGAYGVKEIVVDEITMKDYKNRDWCDYNFRTGPSSFKILNAKKCPIIEVLSQTQSGGPIVTYNLTCKVFFYRYKGMSSMPRYIFGTDRSGRDMLKYVFEGLRTSLLLGIITSAISFIFGLCWGAISGYFGGNVDLAMERFTDILSGLPWIVLMTLCIIHLGQNFAVFALALCLTGWIGTSATTRTQFYRFKGREYVLASRTLGASDMRLIFKHILPNAMGTIITGAVLMIPGVIFSEATISYLGLGLKGMSSLGVILSSNQGELLSHSYLLIFPSVIIALLEISFNLFGNGLRDAINPTLKGEDE
jgi:ABC-type dipeptide/oligopeptide/nickel transport system permease subunit